MLLAASARAQFVYVTNSGTIAITGHNGPGGNVTIPSTIHGLPVTSLGPYAFWGGASPTSVTIPNSVTNIGEGALCCASLTNIDVAPQNPAYAVVGGVLFNLAATTLIQYPEKLKGASSYSIPDSVTSIGDYAFYECRGLTGITIPSGVTNIGAHAFGWCDRLANVTIPDERHHSQ
jgi:hypothetical protein